MLQDPTNGKTPKVNQPMSNKKVSNAAAIAASEVFGVSHLTKLTIVVEGTQIKSYKHFHLSQTTSEHHHFSLVLDMIL